MRLTSTIAMAIILSCAPCVAEEDAWVQTGCFNLLDAVELIAAAKSNNESIQIDVVIEKFSAGKCAVALILKNEFQSAPVQGGIRKVLAYPYKGYSREAAARLWLDKKRRPTKEIMYFKADPTDE